MLKQWIPAVKPEKEELEKRLNAAQEELGRLQMQIKEHKLPVLVLIEGWGAAGKGSTIGGIIKNIDPRFFKVASMSAPTEEEKRKPFLYRYFVKIPEAGKFEFLDSGWMDEVTKGRLRGELSDKQYAERIESIKRFERQLTDNGYLVLKLFFQIGKKEQKQRQKESPYNFCYFVLNRDRAELYRRIDLRVDQMMEQDLLNEAKCVWEHRDTYKTAAQAIGYKEFFPYFAGESALAPCVEKLKQASRNYAKRQLTWFRHMEGICWLDASAPDVREQAAHLTNEFLAKG